ncbi:hypothetical protein NE236_09045 [Actinoallomurus purpureus]|uniref:hypothetical protein n=1 Tax=Actinoallomurus purpureus TaxID=478114 RepID=UPI002092A943|nr:hypothetical protein [Actinoallomurus purpureus]MCO6005129.1 hypothetical protein [Actinoallomurus purpureus]
MKHDPSVRALLLAMPDVFPWVRHLSTEEVRSFTVELVDALSDIWHAGTALRSRVSGLSDDSNRSATTVRLCHSHH